MFAERNKTGWIGIDAGSTSLKIVQLESGTGLLRVRSRICIPRTRSSNGERRSEETSRKYRPDSVRGEIRAALELSMALKGKRAAVAPSMIDCEVHRLAGKDVREREFDAYVRDSIAHLTASSVAGKQLAFWPAVEQSAPADADWNVISLPTALCDQLYEDLSHNRLRCQAITCVPQALARSVSLTVRESSENSLAVLDWGGREATFTVVHHGSAVYVRALKNCGFDRMVSQLGKLLDINSWEAQRLLKETGIGIEKGSSSPEAMAIKEAVSEPLLQLQSELQRTFEYLKFQRRVVSPQSLLLFGGGVLTPGIVEFLERKLQLPTAAWRYVDDSPQDDSPSLELDAQFGAAFGLSALAWEA